ncbi:hypothetical protein GQX73_g378 [Xylaria multiplex]|uniref:Uncharacterized protein n=1 Tax=Xylaria multiplex TaxID=323545 RepID=A0A7C8N0V4_9PEZI|nr:hypothetical protein GQX73_g378 [Xylaria multiplex]
MARSLTSYTWQNGFAEPVDTAPPWTRSSHHVTEDGQRSNYTLPEQGIRPTSSVSNEYGTSTLRSWPSLYNGTAAYETPPSWKPPQEVDVLICGAGPFGLEMALNLARFNVKFRIVDKAEGPSHSGRADAIQPRALEYLHAWGISNEATEVGPLLNKTILYRNGVKLFHGHSSTCDSRYKGIHIITQSQVEKIYIRDLLRHDVLVERNTVVDSLDISKDPASDNPATVKITNLRTGECDVVRAKYVIGADGAGSRIRELIGAPFDGLATDCYWAIIECEAATDYPHILDFSIVTSSKCGGTIILPREQGLTRFYVHITGADAARITATRKRSRENNSAVGETEVYDHGITPDEVMQRLNEIMSPWKVNVTGQIAWFAVWRVNERVARHFSSPDQRVHIGGDAAHVHSVLGAFGLNSSIYDAANLSWKLALSLQGNAKPEVLLPTYDAERRLFANRVIRASGAYLRFICNLDLPLASLRGLDSELETHDEALPLLDGSKEADADWLRSFFSRNAMFLIGVDGPVVDTILNKTADTMMQRPTSLLSGVRAPDPRVCFGIDRTSYLYDAMLGVGKFHILVFASDLQGPVRQRIAHFSTHGLGPSGFFHRFGGRKAFNVVLVFKGRPREVQETIGDADLDNIRSLATLVYDDRAPDEDAHYYYGINHARGAVMVVRPDLVVGMSTWPEDQRELDEYFAAFLLEAETASKEHD